jgi:predicted Zn-dependent protease
MRGVVAKLGAHDKAAAHALAASARQEYPATMLGPWLEGLVDYSSGDAAAAEKHFREALRGSPRSHRLLTNLIPIWMKQGGALHAADELAAVVKLDPGFEYPLGLEARLSLEGDQPARAEAAMRQGFTAQPASAIPFRELATFYLELDRASDALGVCEQGLARFPQDVDLRLQQARGSVLLGDRQWAVEAYRAALAARPDDQQGVAELAALLAEQPGGLPRALELVKWLETDAPIDPAVLGAMGRVDSKSGAPKR